MAHIAVVPATQAEACIRAFLGGSEVGSLDIDVFYVSKFYFGSWLLVSRDPTGLAATDGVASPVLTKALAQQGINVGEKVLVGWSPDARHDRALRLVAPLDENNQHLIGARYRAKYLEQRLLLSA